MILHMRSVAIVVLTPLAAVTFTGAAVDRGPASLRVPVLGAPAAAAASGTASASPGAKAACPAGMVRIVGEHCDDAELKCLRWLDPPPYQNLRCAEYASPVVCRGKRTTMDFCIDQEEHSEGESRLPRVNVSYREAKAVCAAEGKHLCREDEWEFACEGPEIRPYPYGFSRESGACNIDRTGLGGPDGKLRDLRAPADAYPKCVSPFGVHNMTGNADEWVERDGPHRSVLRGGWWLPGRNRCRAATAEHGERYAASQVGFRCCR